MIRSKVVLWGVYKCYHHHSNNWLLEKKRKMLKVNKNGVLSQAFPSFFSLFFWRSKWSLDDAEEEVGGNK